MNEFAKVLEAVIPVFGIAVIGLVLRKINWLNEAADQSLLRVSINLLYPCLIMDATLGNVALSKVSNLVLAPAVGFGTVAFGFAVAGALTGLTGLKDARERGTFTVTVGIYNYGYVPLPLAVMLFGDETVGVLFLHNLGVEVAMWTLAVVLLGGGARRDWRKLVNVPLVAIVLAVGVNALGLNGYVPTPARLTFHLLGQCAIPMALILIGAVVADHLGEFHARSRFRVMGLAVALRLAVLPVCFLLLARYLPATLELKRVIVLEAAMPAAVFPIVMSRVYGGDPPTALQVVIATSVVGLFTIPVWVHFGSRFVGL